MLEVWFALILATQVSDMYEQYTIAMIIFTTSVSNRPKEDDADGKECICICAIC